MNCLKKQKFVETAKTVLTVLPKRKGVLGFGCSLGFINKNIKCFVFLYSYILVLFYKAYTEMQEVRTT